MAGILRVPRSRGALSGVLLIVLGAWGALIPLVGPYFHYAYTPDIAWSTTSGRIWLEIVPGAAAFLGGLIVLMSSLRPVAMLGAWLAALAGAWFAVGAILSPLWTSGAVSAIGLPVGGRIHRITEQIGFFTGLGVVIAFLAALVIGRLSVIAVRDARLAEKRDARHAADRAPVEEPLVAQSPDAQSPDAQSSAAESPAADEASDPVVYDSTAGRSRAADEAPADPTAEETSVSRA
jgi:hypothetical protein